MPEVLCFDCGYAFEVDYDTPRPTKKCPKCLDKVENKMIDIMFGSDDFYKTQESFE
jgi:predicted Zn-ribbon and HTH transcriptional regulator